MNVGDGLSQVKCGLRPFYKKFSGLCPGKHHLRDFLVYVHRKSLRGRKFLLPSPAVYCLWISLCITHSSALNGIKEATKEKDDLSLSFQSLCKFYIHLMTSIFRLKWKHSKPALNSILQHTKQLFSNQHSSPLGQIWWHIPQQIKAQIHELRLSAMVFRYLPAFKSENKTRHYHPFHYFQMNLCL
jgi:hypothetical protein